MSNLSKRSTVYFDPALHQALKLKAASTDLSLSELVDEAVRLLMNEDQEDHEIYGDSLPNGLASVRKWSTAARIK